MSLEWAERVRGLRKSLDMTLREMGDLLDIADTQISQWEMGTWDPTLSVQRILQFIHDCRSNALNLLSQKPWRETGISWGDRIRNVLEALDWSHAQLSEFMGVATRTVGRWVNYRLPIYIGNRILISLLEIYSSIDKKEWPPALYSEPKDTITPERIKLLRLSLGMKQSELGSVLHVMGSTISQWETGERTPEWCGNLLLRVIETFPRAVDLVGNIPWDDEEITPERIAEVRASLGWTRLELAHFLGSGERIIVDYEKNGMRGLKALGCPKLVWLLLERYPDEVVGYIEGLSSPGGQACPIW